MVSSPFPTPPDIAFALPAQAVPWANPYGRLLVAILVVAVVVLVGRIVLSVAWRLLVVAALVVAVLYGISLL